MRKQEKWAYKTVMSLVANDPIITKSGSALSAKLGRLNGAHSLHFYSYAAEVFVVCQSPGQIWCYKRGLGYDESYSRTTTKHINLLQRVFIRCKLVELEKLQ